ncbi:MAG: hypothetical protein JSV05_03890 [Candidatus Bathyarchaeota archaeon]|nr:MAG: hypothetical protein JSV05_03890 [Candidatus Bathyarchaeota archaeon]
MRNKLLMTLNLLLATVLLASIFFGISTSQPPYDPWLDVTDDGYGGIDDIVATAEHFGASGATTKNVNVTNWPINTAVLVWWGQYLPSNDLIGTTPQDSLGFGQLHILVSTDGLTSGEAVTFWVYGVLWNADHTSSRLATAFTLILNENTPGASITIPVPSSDFQLNARTSIGTDCYIYVSYFLTWA